MPNCFQLLDRSNGKPATFVSIDERMCKELNVYCDASAWYMGWYDIAGFACATGKTLEMQMAEGKEWIEANPDDTHAIEFLKVLEWLQANYTSTAWAEIGRK